MPLGTRLGAGYHTEIRVLSVIVRSSELRRIEEIRRFEAEFGPEPLGEREVLENREVQSLGRRRGVALQAQVAFRNVGGRRQGADRYDGVVSNQWSGERPPAGAALGFLPGTRFGKQLAQIPTQPLDRSVNGFPVCSVRMPLTCQLPSKESVVLLRLLPNFLPRPNGISYTKLPTRLCRMSHAAEEYERL